MAKIKIFFTKESIPFILKALGKTIDKKGFVIDIKTKKLVLDINGNKFKENSLCGVWKDKNGKDKWLTNITQLTKEDFEFITKKLL